MNGKGVPWNRRGESSLRVREKGKEKKGWKDI